MYYNWSDFWSLIQLYRSIKSVGRGILHVIDLLKIANNDIPSIEGRITELERKEDSLNFRIQHAATTFQQFNEREKNMDQAYSDADT